MWSGEAEARAAATAGLAETGVQVIDRPGYEFLVLPVTRLRDSGGNRITPEDHATCPGHAAYLESRYRYAAYEAAVQEGGRRPGPGEGSGC